MRKTPLTDAMVTGNSDPGADEYENLAEFTRQLEEKLATARADIERITSLHNGLMAEADKRYDEMFASQSAELERVKRALRSIKQHFEQWQGEIHPGWNREYFPATEVREDVTRMVGAANDEKCPNALTPDGPVCPRCGGRRGPSGVGGGSWVHY